jgi:hypothetical protein
MAKCVEIMMDDAGAITVKECEPRMEEDGYEAMPAKSLDEAFEMVSGILSATPETMAEQAGFDSAIKE